MDTPESRADKKSDWAAFWFSALLLLLSWVIISSSLQLEAVRNGQIVNWAEPWLSEFTSHVTLLGLVFIIPFMLTRFPLSLENWKGQLPIYVGAFLAFSVLHVLVMVGLRKLSYPVLIDTSYGFGLGSPLNWIYEMRKDVFSFILFLSGFLTSRQIGQLKLEANIAKDDARTNHQLTFKCGGRTIFMQAEEIIWAKAASNYIEIRTENKTHLVRMTLGRLGALLVEAGNAHVQTHRSYLVRKNAICEIVPTGEGDAKLVLTNGENIPASRKYRHVLESH